MEAMAAAIVPPSGFDYDNGGSLTFLGFPLYFMRTDVVYPALRSILVALKPALPTAQNDASQTELNLKCHPKPFAGLIRLSIKKSRGEYFDHAIYNLRGQMVRRFSLDPAKGKEMLTWHSEDETGMRIAQGIYLVGLSGKDRSLTRKILYLNH